MRIPPVKVALVLVCAIYYSWATETTIGEVFPATDALKVRGPSILLFSGTTFDTAVVLKFSGYVVKTVPMWFQIWRPGSERDVYRLVGQEPLEPQSVNVQYDVLTVPDYIFTEQGDILGVYIEGGLGAVGYRFDPAAAAGAVLMAPTHTVSVGTDGRVQVGASRTFSRVGWPYRFALQVTIDTDVEPYKLPFTGIVPTTHIPIPSTKLPNLPGSSDSLRYAGSGLHGKTAAMSAGARAMYLLKSATITSERGVVTSFFAYFVRSEAVVFQLWRLMEGDTYLLVGQHTHTPRHAPGLEQVDLGTGTYIHVRAGDTLGFLNTAYTGVVGYSFLTGGAGGEAGAHAARYSADNPPSVWDTVTFQGTALPYDFALGLYYDTVPDETKYGVPPTRPPPTTPPTSPPLPPSTTLPGPPPPPSGTDRLSSYLSYAPKFLESGAQRTFLLPALAFPARGTLTAFVVFVRNPGPVQLSVWHPLPDGASSYTLVASQDVVFGTEDVMTFARVVLPGGIVVEEGDVLGFSNRDDRGVIGHRFEAVDVGTATDYNGLKVGDQQTFDFLSRPYKFAIGADYIVAPPSTSVAATTATLLTTTAKPKTEDPNIGELKDPTAAAGGLSFTQDAHFLLGILIWLILLTLLFFILVCYMCVAHRPRRPRRRLSERQLLRSSSYMYGYPDPTGVTAGADSAASSEGRGTPSRVNSAYRKYNTYGGLKDIEVIDYFSPTIGSAPTLVKRGDSMKALLPSGVQWAGSVSSRGLGSRPVTPQMEDSMVAHM